MHTRAPILRRGFCTVLIRNEDAARWIHDAQSKAVIAFLECTE